MKYLIIVLIIVVSCKKDDKPQCEIDGVAQYDLVNNTSAYYDVYLDGMSNGRLFDNETRKGNNITRGNHQIKLVHYQKLDSQVFDVNVVPCENFTLSTQP